MIREDTYKNIIERFPSMESDLKLHAIPQLNKNKEDIWTAIKILAFYAVLGVYAYYKYMEMTGRYSQPQLHTDTVLSVKLHSADGRKLQQSKTVIT